MNWENETILDYEDQNLRPSLLVKIVGGLFLFFVLSGVYRLFLFFDRGSGQDVLYTQIPFVFGNLLAGIGLLTGRKIGWYLAIWLLIQRIGIGSYTYFIFSGSSLSGAESMFRPGTFAAFGMLFSILLSISMVVVLYLRSSTRFFRIDRYRQALVPLGAIIFFAAIVLVLQ